MYKEITIYLNKYYDGPKERMYLRIQPEIENILKNKYDDEKKLHRGLEYTDFLRYIIALYVMPEILENDLNKEFSKWITQEGEKGLEVQFGQRIKKLQEIIEVATKAIYMTNELQDEFINLEVSYLNKVSTLLNKETK